MSYVDLIDDTICALITAPGLSGISVLRVSGPRSLEVVRVACPFVPSDPESHRVYFGKFRSRSKEVLDECLITYFQKGRSFTGDETLEISVHGGFSSANRVLSELLALGCRAAERGEFSFRSFYNGKIDLIQAEAIHSLIKSKNEASRAQAVQQLSGRISEKVSLIEDGLLQVLAQIEASIDFSTEDIEPYSLEMMGAALQDLETKVSDLAAGFQKGRKLDEGLRIALVGAPNVGKSSLYNALLGQEKAIVSPIAGTTRDVLESTLNDFGPPIWLLDTAGLRETVEEIEKIGIQKTYENVEQSDLVLLLLDIQSLQSSDLSFLESLTNKKLMIVVTKVDTHPDYSQLKAQIVDLILQKRGQSGLPPIHFISSKTHEGIQQLKDAIASASLVDIHHDESLITQYRQYDHLEKCLTHIQKALNLLKDSASYDLLALEVQSSLREIFHLLGKEFDEQVLDRVFKQFCIGK